jgi:hypothetical protein
MSKNKNPLYVVKGKDVEQAKNMIDLLIKKFNLAPIIALLQSLLENLLKQVQTYQVLVEVKKWVDQIIALMQVLIAKYSPATK